LTGGRGHLGVENRLMGFPGGRTCSSVTFSAARAAFGKCDREKGAETPSHRRAGEGRRTPFRQNLISYVRAPLGESSAETTDATPPEQANCVSVVSLVESDVCEGYDMKKLQQRERQFSILSAPGFSSEPHSRERRQMSAHFSQRRTRDFIPFTDSKPQMPTSPSGTFRIHSPRGI
jgi:hypothetical protein